MVQNKRMAKRKITQFYFLFLASSAAVGSRTCVQENCLGCMVVTQNILRLCSSDKPTLFFHFFRAANEWNHCCIWSFKMNNFCFLFFSCSICWVRRCCWWLRVTVRRPGRTSLRKRSSSPCRRSDASTPPLWVLTSQYDSGQRCHLRAFETRGCVFFLFVCFSFFKQIGQLCTNFSPKSLPMGN